MQKVRIIIDGKPVYSGIVQQVKIEGEKRDYVAEALESGGFKFHKQPRFVQQQLKSVRKSSATSFTTTSEELVL